MTQPTGNQPGDDSSGASTTRQIFLSLTVVAVCWVFLRVGSLIVSVAVSHIWSPDEPVVYAYAFIFRQLIMTFLYPSLLKIFRPAFIPLYNEIKTAEGEDVQAIVIRGKHAKAFALGTIQIGMSLGMLVFGLMWLSPEFMIRFVKAPLSFLPSSLCTVLAERLPAASIVFSKPNLEREVVAVTVRMMRQMAPGILCLMFAEMYLLMFHAEKKFAYPHGAEAAQKISWGLGIVVAALLFGLKDSAISLTYIVACALQLAINMGGMARTFGWVLGRPRFKHWFRTWGKRAGVLVLPLMLGVLYARFRDALNLGFQDALGNVKFVSVEYARQLTNLPMQFLGTIVSLVMLPHLASILHAHGKETHRRTIEGTVEMLTLLSVPIVCVMLVMAPELIALVFINVNWEPADYRLFVHGALAVRMFALGFGFLVLENILLPGLFSVKSMWWPILWGIGASTLQIACLFGLAFSGLPQTSTWFLGGVAFAYPLSRIVKNGTLLLVLRSKTGIFAGTRFVSFLGKVTVLIIGTLAATYLTHKVCGKFLPPIPQGSEAGLLAYKLTIVGQLTVPSLAAFTALAGLIWVTGYKDRAMQLIKVVLKRKKTANQTDESADQTESE